MAASPPGHRHLAVGRAMRKGVSLRYWEEADSVLVSDGSDSERMRREARSEVCNLQPALLGQRRWCLLGDQWGGVGQVDRKWVVVGGYPKAGDVACAMRGGG